MKAEKWEFRTILKIEFKCINCKSQYYIDYDVSFVRHNVNKLNIQCTKCNHLNEVEQ